MSSDKNSSGCSLCLNENRGNIELFGQEGKSLKICEVLSKYFWFKVNNSVNKKKI